MAMLRPVAKKLRAHVSAGDAASSLRVRRQTNAAATIPESADVVIIGGGSAGCNTLYQLAKLGVNGVLLERAKVTAGTTWHTAGLVWRLRPNDVEIELLRDTRDLLMSLEAETGMDPGWTQNGGLYIAHSQERLDEYRRLATLGRSFGIESAILDPVETAGVFPLLDPGALVGSLHSPGDGVVDPAMLCAALNHASRAAGAQIFEGCPVNKILTGRNVLGTKQVTGVVTPHGTIKTNCVVNCSGVWAREVADLVGLRLPLVAMKHAYVVSERMDGVKGLPNVRDHDAAVYFRVQGEALCLGGYEPNPIILDKVPADFNFGLYELDWSVFGTHLGGAVKLVPGFASAGIRATVCGPESFTPDHKPLMGAHPALAGFFLGCGFNSAGMMLGGGCARQLAAWIVHGRPELPMFAYDIRRFAPRQCADSAWIGARSHESYVKNYSIVFPHDEAHAGRDFQQDPLHQELVQAGAVMEERHGWERPGWYSADGPAPTPKYDWYGAYGTPPNADTRYHELLKQDYSFGFPKHHALIGEEALACREQAALFNMSYFGKLFLSGPDAQKAADWIFTADTRQPVGKTVYSCMLNAAGGVEGDVTVTAIETGNGGPVQPIFQGRGFYIVSGGASAYHTWAHIQSLIDQKAFKVKLTNAIDKIAVLSIQGPNSRALLSELVDASLGDQHFAPNTSQLVTAAGHACRALRVSFVGELGWELHVPCDVAVAVHRAVMHQGRKHGLRLAGYRALYALSSEKGTHLWHADLRADDGPLEAGLGFTCRPAGAFHGGAALHAARTRPRAKRLAFLRLRDPHVPLWGLECVLRDGEPVGYLRRGEFAHALGASIGQGYIRRQGGEVGVTADYLKAGKYEVEVMGERHEATLHLKSPFDPLNKRPKGIYDDPIPIRQNA